MMLKKMEKLRDEVRMKSNNQWSKSKSSQWKFIIIIGLILIFGKGIANKIGDWFSSNQFIALASQQIQSQTNKTNPPLTYSSNQLIVEIKNDTQNDYIVAGKLKAGHLYFRGNSLLNGESKKFVISAEQNNGRNAFGDIVFTSSPINGANHTICQTIHILNYDLKKAESTSQPLKVNLSSIASRLDCKNNIAVQTDLNIPDEGF